MGSSKTNDKKSVRRINLLILVSLLPAFIIISIFVGAVLVIPNVIDNMSKNDTASQPTNSSHLETEVKSENQSSDLPVKEKDPSQAQATPAPVQPVPKPKGKSESKAGCKWYDDVAYVTIDVPDNKLKEGSTNAVGGVNGTRKVCTNDTGTVISEEITFQPVNRTIYHGTYTREQALSDARLACQRTIPAGSWDSTWMGDCVSDKVRSYGF